MILDVYEVDACWLYDVGRFKYQNINHRYFERLGMLRYSDTIQSAAHRPNTSAPQSKKLWRRRSRSSMIRTN